VRLAHNVCDAHSVVLCMSQERIIRKYANRRLYDTQASRHVTLADLRELVVAGEKLKVVDDKSGEDLTRSVLLQIIADQEQFGAPVLSTALLEMIIRYYASPVQSLLTRYLEQGFTALMQQQDVMRSDMSKLFSSTPLAPFMDLARANMDALAKMQSSLFGMPSAGPRSEPGTGPGTSQSPAPEAPAAPETTRTGPKASNDTEKR